MTRVRRTLEALLERLAQIGADPSDDSDTRQSKALLVLFSVLILPISLVWGVLYLALGAWVGIVPLVYFAVLVAAIAIFARRRNLPFLLRANQVDIVLAPTLSMIPLGGFVGASAVGLWGMLAPIGALVFVGWRSATRWWVLFLAVFVVSGIVGDWLGPSSVLPDWFVSAMLALNIVFAGTMVFTLLAVFAKQRQDAQERADNLLLNILPRSIAERLKSRPETIADQFTAASVLFADVVDFTPKIEHLAPAEIVGMLDDLFSHFDGLAERYDLEKIKTIGDAYMVAAGVPTPRPDHARALALIALDMLEAVRSENVLGRLGLELRIGINSGPVVAGVIGRKRFLYDLWGDAVNTASRMESHGTPGHIQVTEATYDLLRDEFELVPRGGVQIKGKGEMQTWYVTGKRTAAQQAGASTDHPEPVAVAAVATR
jgi:adenylate cyclase